MKNIKDITLSIFAVIGFVAILSSFTQEVVYTEKQISNGTPESHVWNHVLSTTTASTGGSRVYLYNKVTGEMRKYSYQGMFAGDIKESQFYQVMIENKQGETSKVLRSKD